MKKHILLAAFLATFMTNCFGQVRVSYDEFKGATKVEHEAHYFGKTKGNLVPLLTPVKAEYVSFIANNIRETEIRFTVNGGRATSLDGTMIVKINDDSFETDVYDRETLNIITQNSDGDLSSHFELRGSISVPQSAIDSFLNAESVRYRLYANKNDITINLDKIQLKNLKEFYSTNSKEDLKK